MTFDEWWGASGGDEIYGNSYPKDAARAAWDTATATAAAAERERCLNVVLATEVVTESVRVGGFPNAYEDRDDAAATLNAAAKAIREGKP